MGAEPVVTRTFRVPESLYLRIGRERGVESLNSEVVRRLERSFLPRGGGTHVLVEKDGKMVARRVENIGRVEEPAHDGEGQAPNAGSSTASNLVASSHDPDAGGAVTYEEEGDDNESSVVEEIPPAQLIARRIPGVTVASLVKPATPDPRK